MAQAPAAFLEQLKNVVLQRAAEDDLVLPSLPHIASNALRQLDRGFDPKTLAGVIEPDPLVTARLLRVANSPSFSSGPAAVTVARAIERVGRFALSSFLEKIAAETVFTSRDAEINRSCRRFWEHSLATAIVSRRMAKLLPGPVSDELAESAYMAGLLHDLGKPILAAMLLDAERRLVGGQATRTWLSVDEFVAFVMTAHKTIGLLVAAKWELPALVRHALADVNHYDQQDPVSVPNLVRMANALVKQEGIHIGAADMNAVHRLATTGRALFGLREDQIPRLTRGVLDEVAAAVA